MTHYIAIIEEEEGKAPGVWFPDLPGCFSGGDTLDEAILNASEAIGAWGSATLENGRPLPAPRSLAEIRKDPQAAVALTNGIALLVALPVVLDGVSPSQ